MTIQDNTTYKKAGVDIEAGNNLVKAIAPLAKATQRQGADTDLGGFGGLFDIGALSYKDPILVSATDGVGTKLHIAISMGVHETVGIDLVAMCVNDLIVQGAEPLFFLDYFATGKLENDVAQTVVAGIAQGCKQAGAALIGGETAEMPGMYKAGDYDLAGFAVGAVERENMLPKKSIEQGDTVIGLASSGIHSNGFSLVRYLLKENNLEFTDQSPFEDKSWGELLLTPTRIYVRSCLSAIKQYDVKGLAHITGGGIIENIPRILPDHLAVEIDASSWQLPPIFSWLKDAGNIATDELLTTFNCGIGMVLVIAAEDKDKIVELLQAQGETVYEIGTIIERTSEPVLFQSLEALC